MSRAVPTTMTEGWNAQAKIGPRRPVVRAIVQRQHLYRFDYDTAWAQGGDATYYQGHKRGHFSSFIFGEDAPYRELPNIKSCSWERSIGQDAASCTIVMLNSEITPIGNAGDASSGFDQTGFFTHNRGNTNRWGHTANGWEGILVPDVVIKTFEGYGCDKTVAPPQDPFLMQSGTWKIDKVTYTDNGTITIECRDLASILLDEVSFPPVIPFAEYPLTWVKNHQEEVPGRDANGGHWKDTLRTIGTASSSNDNYVGAGLTNAPYANYVGAGGGVEGHQARDAIVTHLRDTDAHKAQDEATFWRSTGQDSTDSYVWWQLDVTTSDRAPVAAVRVRPAGGPYRVYVSIHNGSRWVGKKKIPYERNGLSGTPGNVDIGADIPFVMSFIGDRFFAQDWTLPRVYQARKIRLTFTRLRDTGVGEHPFRAGLRELNIYTSSNVDNLGINKGTVTRLVGNYGDYTDVVKWVCAWAAWYWPPHETGMDYIRVQSGGGSPPTKDYVTFATADPRLPKGRVWGDFMRTGTAGVADLTVDLFDKKPLMDIINYVRDLTGFLFFIDETGGVVWRMPNLWTLGNYLSPGFESDGRPGNRGRTGRTSEIVTLDEEETLLDYTTVLDSHNIRERIFVANVTGGKGTVIKGFNPYPTGLLRVAGWTDQNFATKNETKVMANLINAQTMFSYKTSHAVIPGYPKIQCDDQIRIYERTTNETYYHYVMGISSQINMDEGTWTYDLSTHWLGEDPTDAWAVDATELDAATQAYLVAIGYVADRPDDADWIPA